MKQEATNGNEAGEGFTMIPHSVFDWLLTIELSKREQNVVWLVVRLQYGCPKYFGAQFRQADLVAVGIHPSHAKKVIRSLIDKKVLVYRQEFNRYVLGEPRRKNNDASFRLRQLIHTNSYRKSNDKVTVSATTQLPNKQVKTYQKSNSEKLPKQQLNRYSKNEIHDAKDNEIKVKIGKRIKVAGQFIDLATFSPRNEKEVVAFETWQMLEHENPKRLGFYLNLATTGLSVDDFDRIRTEVMNDQDVSNRSKLFSQKAVECIKQRLGERPVDNA